MATNDEKVETPSGAVNGFNVNFQTSISYQAGTLVVFIDGNLYPFDDDGGLVEDDPVTGTFHLKVAPVENTGIVVRYIEA